MTLVVEISIGYTAYDTHTCERNSGLQKQTANILSQWLVLNNTL